VEHFVDPGQRADGFPHQHHSTSGYRDLEAFPSRIIVLLDHRDEILCPAGLLSWTTDFSLNAIKVGTGGLRTEYCQFEEIVK
jgi:hypothetical protein